MTPANFSLFENPFFCTIEMNIVFKGDIIVNLLKTSLFLCFLVSEGLFFKVRADSYDLYPSYPMAARKNDMAAEVSVLGSYETGSEEFEMEYGFISLKKSSESKGYGLGGKFSLDLFRAVRLGGIFRYKSREEEIKNQTEVETTEGVLDPEVFLEAQYGVGGNFVEFGVKYSPKTQDPISASKDKKGTPGNGGNIYEVKGAFLGKSGSFYLYPSFHYFSYGSSKLKDQDGEITSKDAYSCYKIMIESGILLNQNASFFAKVSFCRRSSTRISPLQPK